MNKKNLSVNLKALFVATSTGSGAASDTAAALEEYLDEQLETGELDTAQTRALTAAVIYLDLIAAKLIESQTYFAKTLSFLFRDKNLDSVKEDLMAYAQSVVEGKVPPIGKKTDTEEENFEISNDLFKKDKLN